MHAFAAPKLAACIRPSPLQHLAANGAHAAATRQLLQAAPDVALLPTPGGESPLWLVLRSDAPLEQRFEAACSMLPFLPPAYGLLALRAPVDQQEQAALRLPLVVELVRQHLPLGSHHLWNLVRWAGILAWRRGRRPTPVPALI